MRKVALATTLLVGLAPGPSWAQSPGDETARIDAIEQQIRKLQAELARVRHDLAVRDAQVHAA